MIELVCQDHSSERGEGGSTTEASDFDKLLDADQASPEEDDVDEEGVSFWVRDRQGDAGRNGTVRGVDEGSKGSQVQEKSRERCVKSFLELGRARAKNGEVSDSTRLPETVKRRERHSLRLSGY